MAWDTDHLEYRIGADTSDPFMDTAANLLGTNRQFSVEVKAPHGAVITIQRTTPSRLDSVMNLY
jgi:archaellin